MSEKEKRILEKLALLKEDQVIPSTIGHILRDKYQVKITSINAKNYLKNNLMSNKIIYLF